MNEEQALNYYEHHLGDYAAATAHLSWDEDMAYTRLIRAYYHHEKPIPADLKEACRLVRAQSPAQRKAVEAVLREFFTRSDDGWHQKRCDEEIQRFKDKQSKAKRSADARWNAKRSDSEGNANASRTHTERNANALPTQSEGNAPSLQSPVSSPNLQAPDSGSTPDISPEPDSSVAGAPSASGQRSGAGRVRKVSATKTKRIPAEHPIEPMRLWALQNTPDANFDLELATLRDHEFRDAHSDWDAVIRNWLRRAQKTAKPNGSGGQTKFDRLQQALKGGDSVTEF